MKSEFLKLYYQISIYLGVDRITIDKVLGKIQEKRTLWKNSEEKSSDDKHTLRHGDCLGLC